MEKICHSWQKSKLVLFWLSYGMYQDSQESQQCCSTANQPTLHPLAPQHFPRMPHPGRRKEHTWDKKIGGRILEAEKFFSLAPNCSEVGSVHPSPRSAVMSWSLSINSWRSTVKYKPLKIQWAMGRGHGTSGHLNRITVSNTVLFTPQKNKKQETTMETGLSRDSERALDAKIAWFKFSLH